MVSPVVNWEALQAEMETAGVDAVVASSAVNVTWLSDFWSLSQWSRRGSQAFAAAFRTPQRDVAVVLPLGNADLLDVDGPLGSLRAEPYGSFAYTAGDRPTDQLDGIDRWLVQRSTPPGRSRTAVEALLDVLRDRLRPGARIAVDTDGLLHDDLAAIRDGMPRCEVGAAAALFLRSRTVKTGTEVVLLRSAAQITDLAIRDAFANTTEGAEIEIQRRYLQGVVRRDAAPIFQVIVAGVRSARPNGQANEHRLAPGELVRFDGGCRFRWYAADISRTAVVGEPDDKQATFYAALNAGLEAAVAAAGPGVPCRDVFHAAMDVVRAEGIPHYERNHCGHGIGIENYDFPHITPTSKEVLQPGMVICLETPYYELGWGGLQVEDTFAVTQDGLERFTTVPDTLLPIGDERWTAAQNGE